MNPSTIFTKTAKGIAELKIRDSSLSKIQSKSLAMINGSTAAHELANSLMNIDSGTFFVALEDLLQLGLIKEFQTATRQTPQNVVIANPGTRAQAVEAMDFSSHSSSLHVTELTAEESVLAWADAKRGAEKLASEGFFIHAEQHHVENMVSDTLTILIVEDDNNILGLLDALLTRKGFHVRKAMDMPTAFERLKDQPAADLVLLDVNLPGMPGKDGFHILRQIRQSADLCKLPVIMLTAEVSDEKVMQGLKEGADGYVFKPFKWESVYKCIRHVMHL